MTKEKKIWNWFKVFCSYKDFNEFDKLQDFSYGRGISTSNLDVVWISTSSFTYAKKLEEWLKQQNIKFESKKVTYSELMKLE